MLWSWSILDFILNLFSIYSWYILNFILNFILNLFSISIISNWV